MRVKPTAQIEADVLHACRRRCCICFYLEQNIGVRKGQIAHIDQNRANSDKNNLVWLCFEHHDEFDSRTSQSKGLTREEVRRWRDKLIKHFHSLDEKGTEAPSAPALGNDDVKWEPCDSGHRVWRFPLWQVANEPELFAFLAQNGADGVCAIERIDLPDGRIVVVCTQVAGNPGQSITNSAETICQSICDRFQISFDRLVWLETYDQTPTEWNRVVFCRDTSGQLVKPSWYTMRKLDWHNLYLRPIGPLSRNGFNLISNIEKLFPWPTEGLTLSGDEHD